MWYYTYRYMQEELKLDVLSSNPYQTKVITASKKKTDKLDVKILVDLLCGGYIATCYVLTKEIVDDRQFV